MSEVVWSWAARAAAVAGIVGTMISASGLFKTSAGPRLAATAIMSFIVNTDEFIAAQNESEKRRQKGNLESVLGKLPEANRLSSTEREAIAAAIAKQLEEPWRPDKDRSVGIYYKEYIQFSIRNKGEKVAENVFVQVPVRGLAEFVNENKKQSLDVEDSIPVGSIRPGQTLSIRFFTTDSAYQSNESAFAVSHKEGTAPVEFYNFSVGIASTAARVVQTIVDNSILIYVVGGMALFALLMPFFEIAYGRWLLWKARRDAFQESRSE